LSSHRWIRLFRSVARFCSFPAVACLAVAAGVAPAHAQGQAPHDSIVVSVLTMGPGQELFERFGHQSIRIHDLTTGLDSAYNWGMFSFEQPHFLVRFLTGDTNYWMQGFPSDWLVSAYRDSGRAVWEQELSLTSTEKDSLWRFIKWNAREENKWYRYDYYRDNCGTKVRDVLNMVLGGSLERALAAHEHGVTYRSETLRLSRAYPLINFGMDFVLGRPADATLSAWDEMFIPMRLQQLIRDIRVQHSDGSRGRLVLSERQLVVDQRYQDADMPPEYFAPALAVGVLIGGALLALCIFRGNLVSARWWVGIIGFAWNLLAGVTGLLLLCAELFTRHAAYMGQNVNVLLATPASLALAVLFPLALRGSASARLVRAARSLSILAAACSVTTVLLRLVPALTQENRPMLALAVPVQAALALALWRATGARRGAAL
jgi:hypothetical protein